MAKLEEVFLEYKAMRSGIIKALTADFVNVASALRAENMRLLCLNGSKDGNWVLVEPCTSELPTGQIVCNAQNTPDDLLRETLIVNSEEWLRQLSYYYSTKLGVIEERDRFLSVTQMFFSISREVMHYVLGGPFAFDENVCRACGNIFVLDEFWLLCDVCGAWFHGQCVGVSEDESEKIPVYACEDCSARSNE